MSWQEDCEINDELAAEQSDLSYDMPAEEEDYYDEQFAEPDLDFGFEHDSAMMSAGWGTDEDYGFYGGDDY